MQKGKRLSQYGGLPLYPWFVGVISIIHLYTNNLGQGIEQDVVVCLLLALLGTTIAFLAINHVLRDRHRTAVILTICSIAFSLSGHVYALVFLPKSLGIWTLMILAALACLCMLLLRIRTKAGFRQLTRVFNLVMFCLLALQVITLVVRLVEVSRYASVSEAYTAKYRVSNAPPKVDDAPRRPDIYYIIPDGYPSDIWLAQAMNFDNTEFSNALKDRGFVIADHAQSNYSAMFTSLASTLNMQYYESNPSPFNDLDYLRLEIANSLVARQLIKHGYMYIQFLSGFWVPSPLADVNRDFTRQGPVDVVVSEKALADAVYRGDTGEHFQFAGIELSCREPFIPLYVETTLLRLAWSRLEQILDRGDAGPLPKWGPNRFLATTNEAAAIASLPEATFTLDHFMKPHLPTVFDEQGNFVGRNYKPSQEEFFADFRYVNSQFLRMFDEILENSTNPPIIILQADHGGRYGQSRAQENSRLTHFGVCAAYYLPEAYSIDLPEDYTSTKTFPLILNKVLGATYELQENHLIELLTGYDNPFLQANVTAEFANWV